MEQNLTTFNKLEAQDTILAPLTANATDWTWEQVEPSNNTDQHCKSGSMPNNRKQRIISKNHRILI